MSILEAPRISLLAYPELFVDPMIIAYWHEHYQRVLNAALGQREVAPEFVERIEQHVAISDLAYRQYFRMHA